MNNCDDAISRADLIKHFTKWKDEMAYAFGEEYSGVDVLGNAIQIIKYRPSVQPSRVECEDAISRHKAIVMITAYEGKSAQIEALEQLPSVQPSRKDNIECEWAKMTYDTDNKENKIMFEFSDGTKKRVTYTEEIKRTTVGE